MKAAAWVCLLLPLASTVLITLGGTRISRRAAGYISALTTIGAFVAAAVAFFVMLGEDAHARTHVTTSWTWLAAGQYHFGLTLLTDQLSVMMMLIVGGAVASLVALGLLGGAVAKSAQIPLHTWLPDAMEGPTPVSALIHAATMVTAGVYLIVRCHPLFEKAYVIEDLAAGLGAATLLMAGLIALVQVDIKRVIAYSTMSQIGYMFVGAGLGAYPNAMFHLMTHAFFKALLFLAAGIAIHAVVGEQDIRKLAGIGRLMPFTKLVFLIGSLALVGIPPFAGFFSKDPILAAGLDRGWYGILLGLRGLAGRVLTGVYAFRLYFIVFTGEPSAFAREHFHDHRGREGPLSMRWTVGALALLSLIGGFLQFAPLWHPLSTCLGPVAKP